MGATEAFELSLPTAEDLEAAALAWDASRNRFVIRAGSMWWRALTAKSEAEARAFAATCYASPKLARFSPIEVGGDAVPAAYAAGTRETALWELVLRKVRHEGSRRVPRHETRDRWLVGVSLVRDLDLLNLCRPFDSNLVTGGKRPPDLSRAWPSAYSVTRQWAQELYARIPQLDGLMYESHQLDRHCIVLYQPTDPVVFSTAKRPVRVEDEPVRSILEAEADKAGAVIDFED
jgi:RES domain